MKTLICDDHKIVRAGIKQLLEKHPAITSMQGAGDGAEAIDILQNDSFDLVLLDVSLPGISGLEVLELIKTKWNSTKVLMLSMYAKEQDVIRSFRLGASGYLAIDAAPEELFDAVKKIASGGKYISASLAERIAVYVENEKGIPKHNMLSKREYVTMIKIARGETLREIGNELFISNKTVSTYRTRVMKKMNLSKNTQLTKYCLENQLI